MAKQTAAQRRKARELKREQFLDGIKDEIDELNRIRSVKQRRESASGHPKAEELAEDLDQQCATLAWPTHVTHHHLEHPERFECGDFGIRRKTRSP